MIFKKFPELEKNLAKESAETNQKNIIKNFINCFKKEKDGIIKAIEQEEQSKLLKDGEMVLDALGEIMEFHIDSQQEYTIFLSILPFSPFEKNSFYFSILSKIESKENEHSDILSLLAHEVSHFILFDILRSKNITLERHELYFLKEILAVIVLKNKLLVNFLKAENYRGNTILHKLYVRDGIEAINIVEYFEKIYADKMHENKNFEEYLDIMIKEIRNISGALKHKYSFWMNKKMDLDKKLEFLKEYSRPVPLNRNVDKK